MYIWKITQHTVPKMYGTMRHTMKSKNHPRHGTRNVIKYPTNRSLTQSPQKNTTNVFGPPSYNSLPAKYLKDIESVKTAKLKVELDKFLKLIPYEPKMSNYLAAARSNGILDQLSHRMPQGIDQGGGVRLCHRPG